MIPLSDDNPHIGTPFVTWTLIGICVAVFLWELSLPPPALEASFGLYGAVPAVLFGYEPGPADLGLPVWSTAITSMFLHGGFGHLFGNMLYLYIFGDNIEMSMGRLRYTAFYLICGVAAVLSQGLLAPQSTIPLIGASGAISGVLGAYLLLHPLGRVRMLFAPLPIPIFKVFHVPALLVLGLWFVIQLLSAVASDADTGGVAFWAHVGGFVAGMALVPIFKKPEVPLFQRPMPRGVEFRRRPGSRRGPWG